MLGADGWGSTNCSFPEGSCPAAPEIRALGEIGVLRCSFASPIPLSRCFLLSEIAVHNLAPAGLLQPHSTKHLSVPSLVTQPGQAFASCFYLGDTRVGCPQAREHGSCFGAEFGVPKQRLMSQSRVWCPKARVSGLCLRAGFGVPKQNLVPKAESGVTKPGTVAHVLEQSLVTQSRIGCPKAEFGVPEQSLASQSRFWCLKADFGVPKHSLVS